MKYLADLWYSWRVIRAAQRKWGVRLSWKQRRQVVEFVQSVREGAAK